MGKINLITRLFIAAIIILTCAKQMPPRGGPEDKIPPTIVNINPIPGATNVPTNTKIEMTFSERMRINTVEDAVFMSPLPSENLFFRWKGKKFKIDFPDTLKKDRTYVLTIGAKSTDLHNNRMGILAIQIFSTFYDR